MYCEGPENNAYCELRDHKDGTFTLVMQAQDVGSHELHIKYENVSIPGKVCNNSIRHNNPGNTGPTILICSHFQTFHLCLFSVVDFHE